MFPVRLKLLVLLFFVPLGVVAQPPWTVGRVNLPNVNTAHSIAFGNGRFVVTLGGPAGASGVAWSTDGESWQPGQVAAPMRESLPQQGTVRFIRGAFYLAGDSNVLRSLDGVTWETLPVVTGFRSLRGIATDGRGMLIGSANLNDVGLLYTADRVTWRRTPPLPGAESSQVAVHELAWVAGRYFVSYFIYTSTGLRPATAATADGASWEPVETFAGLSHLASGNGRMVAYPVNGTTVASTDGRTYAPGVISLGIMNGGAMAFAGGRFFFTGSLHASFDGLTWAPLASNPINFGNMRDIAYGNGRYIAVGYGAPVGSAGLRDIIVRLAASAPPVIADFPVDHSVAEGSPMALSATLQNPDTATTFQWRRDGQALPGATNATFTRDRATLADAGRYTVEIRNAVGTTTSDAVAVTVVPFAEVGRLVNLSVLSTLDEPDAVLTVGFVVGGAGTSGTKPLLVRAAGPSLSRFGVERPNSDPKLELHGPAGKLAESDQWGGAPALVSAAQSVGAFPFLAPDSRDAALVTDVPIGDATARVFSGSNTGAVIAEVYDATPAAAFSAATPRLLNASVLKPLVANTTLSAGFVIGGRTARTVLIRAVGPSLTRFGVAAPLPNPQLTLLRAGTAGAVATNDDWAGAEWLRAAMSAVGAFELPPDSRDAVIFAALEPGNYVAEAKGGANTAGPVLVEIYVVP